MGCRLHLTPLDQERAGARPAPICSSGQLKANASKRASRLVESRSSSIGASLALAPDGTAQDPYRWWILFLILVCGF